MILHPKLFKEFDGERYVSGAGILILAAGALYGATNGEFDWMAKHKAQATINELLSAARSKGFTQSEVLETLLAVDPTSERTADLAMKAIDSIGGGAALLAAMERAGFNPTEGA